MDKLNNVYQITPDEEIGMFIGLYDKILNKIFYVSE